MIVIDWMVKHLKHKIDKYNRRRGIYKHYLNWPYLFQRMTMKPESGYRIYRLDKGLKAKIRVNLSDFNVIKDIFGHQDYSGLIGQIKESSTVIDIGANIGIFSIYSAILAKRGRVYAYEPHPANFQLLRENVRINNLSERVHSFQYAVAGQSGERKLQVSTEMGAHSLVGNRCGEGLNIRAVTLRDIFEQNSIVGDVFMKIDCEGAEYEILFNTPPKYLLRIKAMAGEYHPVDRVGLFYSLSQYLSDLGFEVNKTKVSKHSDRGLFYAYKRR